MIKLVNVLLICMPLATFGGSFISKKRFPEDVT